MNKPAYDWLVEALFDDRYRDLLIRAARPGGVTVTIMSGVYEKSRCGLLEQHGFIVGHSVGVDSKGRPLRKLTLTELAKPVFL